LEGEEMGLFPRRGYILLLVGVLLGLLMSIGISLLYSGGGTTVGEGEMPKSIQFDFLYTSEKQGWIEEVTPRFEDWFKDRFGITVQVRLTVGGTHETVNHILQGSMKPTVWSPASAIWIPYINTKWKSMGHQGDIAGDWTPLVISPVVLAGWKSFLEEYDVKTFLDLYSLALMGVDFKYGHPDPLLSNGGVMVVILEFSEAAGKRPDQLTIEDLKNETILNIVRTIESKVVTYGKSTGFFGNWAAENGPSAINFFGVYENVVLDNALKAAKKWGDPLVAIYPVSGSLLSDHPFVFINGEWVTQWQRFAASQYLIFLLKEDVQELAEKHGFRPANPSVPLDSSLFSPENGVTYDVDVPVLKPPSGEVLESIFTAWVKVRNPGMG
jgi:Ca-activated chloride channel family protein